MLAVRDSGSMTRKEEEEEEEEEEAKYHDHERDEVDERQLHSMERRLMGNGGKIEENRHETKRKNKSRNGTKLQTSRIRNRKTNREGSFGIVYQAILRGKERVVLKRPKLNIEGRQSFKRLRSG